MASWSNRTSQDPSRNIASLSAFEFYVLNLILSAVADPGFPRGWGRQSSRGGHQHTILPNFPQNCMKLKEFGSPGGARVPRFPLDPPMVRSANMVLNVYQNLRIKSLIGHLNLFHSTHTKHSYMH